MPRITLVTAIFVWLAAAQIASAQTFSDVPTDHWAHSYVEILVANGVTGGCGNNNYCPEDKVTRAQMAVFLERGMRGSSYTPPPASGNVFFDVAAQDFGAAWIEQLYLDGITGGCGGSNYCPGQAVTRAQMAVFLLRAKHGAAFTPPTASGIFGDVDLSHWAVHWVEALAAEGITGGCGAGNYCPDEAVTRAQMAVFLVRAFDLVLAPRSEAGLSALSLSAGALSPAFDSNTLSYEATVGVAELSVTPVASDAGATITVNGTPVLSGQPSPAIPMSLGLNAIVVTITAEDGVSSSSYTIVVRRANTTLTSLSVSVGELSPVFNPDISNYTVVTTQTSYGVTPTASDVNASIVVNGSPVASGTTLSNQPLSLGNNTLSVEVTAEDGVTTHVYTVTIYRQSTEARLGSLSVSAGGLSPAFSSGTFNYSVTVPATVEATTVTAVPLSPSATLTVNGVSFVGTSDAIPLNYGNNVVTINVTAEDGVTAVTYTVNITRLNNDASLASISFSKGALSPAFDPSVTSYTMTVAYPFITVTPEASDPDARIEVGGQIVPSGNSSAPIQMNLGFNAVVVQVTSTDGNTRNYVFSITRVINTDANLEGLEASSGNLAPAFLPTHYEYTVEAGFLATAVQVTPYANPTSTILVNGEPVASGEASMLVAVPESSSVTVVIDVMAEDGVSTARYTLNITRQSATSFAQQAYVKASNNDVDDIFGHSVALHDNTLAVGAIGEDSAATGINGDQANSSAPDSGAVYVFTRDSGGTWSQQAYIKSSNPAQDDHFGSSVSLHGDTLAVGAPLEDGAGKGINGDQGSCCVNRSGAVYVFSRDGAGTWSQQAYVKASNPGLDDFFGYSVALHGDTLAVGAVVEDSAATGINGDELNWDAPDSGAVYVFTRDIGGTWSQQAYVKASNTNSLDSFGVSVALHGDTLAVGATLEGSAATGVNGNEADNSAPESGAVYVFTRDTGGAWSQQAYVKASNTNSSDSFGASVALHGDTLAVGARREGSAATGVNGNEADNSAPESGAVYVFTRDSNGAWSQQTYVKASNPAASDRFGHAIALYGDTLAVGAWLEDGIAVGVNGDPGATMSGLDTGAVFVFTRDDFGDWRQQAYVKAAVLGTRDRFGDSVALHGDTLAVGAKGEDSAATDINGNQDDNSASDSGAVSVFR